MDLTFREFAAYRRGVARRDQTAWQRALWAAWQGASFRRAKRLPRLDRIMQKLGWRKAKPKTPKQMLAFVEQLNEALGGEPRDTGETS